MGLPERPLPRPEDHYIKPDLVGEMGREALREGISIRDYTIASEVLSHVQEEVMNDTIKKNLILEAQSRRHPHTAKLVADIHTGLAQAIGQDIETVQFIAQVLDYDRAERRASADDFVLPPHQHTTFQYLQAVLTLYGSAFFYYCPAGTYLHQGRAEYTLKFKEDPKDVFVMPGTLIIMRARQPQSPNVLPMAHAVGHPTGEDGRRIAIAVSYLPR